MLLKRNVEKMSVCAYARMPMKIKGLSHFGQNMYEKKGAWLEPQVENRDGACISDESGVRTWTTRQHEP
jgi:hypothetical protein